VRGNDFFLQAFSGSTRFPAARHLAQIRHRGLFCRAKRQSNQTKAALACLMSGLTRLS